MMVAMKYFISCVFINFYVIFTTKTTIAHAGGLGGSTEVNQLKTHRNFTTQKVAVETLTHYGKEFVLGFINPSHNSHETTGKLEIFIQARENNTKVRVYIPYTTFNKTYILTSKVVTKIDIPKQLSMSGTTKVERKGVGITADKDITVYAFSKANGQGDGFVVHPKGSLGREYVVTSYAGSHSNIGIVGVEENTTVSILLNGASRLTYNRRVYKHTDTLRITLNDLETFHIRSRFDLSGARIIANKPVVVFSGSSCELSKRSPNCGFVIEQLPSVKTWGQHYVVYSEQSGSMQGGLVRVTSGTTNTVVRFENGMTTNIRGIGGVVDLVIKSRWPTRITCSPFCMATLYKAQLSLNKLQSGPSAVILPAIDQFLPHYSVHIPKGGHGLAFLSLLIKCSAAGGLVMNGVLLTDLIWRVSERRTWCGATVKVAKQGVYTLHHQDGRTSFGVLVNGIGEQHSYSYFGGRSFQAIRVKKGVLKKTKPTDAVKLAKIVGSTKSAPNAELYKFTTVGLGALFGVMLMSLVVYLILRYKCFKNAAAKDAEETDASKLPDERTYQSIRGFPRRNTHSYEEVPLKQSSPHAAITDILFAGGKGEDYENLKFHHEKERDNNTYVPMNEALSGSVMAEQLLTMSDESDIYLTMKKLIIKEPHEETHEETEPEETIEHGVILL